MKILYLGKVPLDSVISLADVFREVGILYYQRADRQTENKPETGYKI